MTRKEYLEAAARTCPSLGNPLEDKLHMILGIIDEDWELLEALGVESEENIIKEDGDRWWYFANLCRMTGNSYIFMDTSIPATVQPELGPQFKLAGLLKKELAYGKPVSAGDMVHYLHMINWYLIKTSEELGHDIPTVLERNIAKLKVRFPEKFEANLAINKNEDNE